MTVGLRVTSGTDEWIKLLITQLAGRHLRLTGVFFISRADNEGELKLPSFLVLWNKLWLCAPLRVWEHGGQKLTGSQKIQTWVGCSGKAWREIGVRGETYVHHKRKKLCTGQGKAEGATDVQTPSCKLWESNPFFGLYFCFLCNSSSPKGFRADFPRVTKPVSKIWETKSDWENCFSPLYQLNR